MELEEKVRILNKELNFIINDEIRDCVIAVLEKVNEKFFTEPASSTGKYHPSYALGEGGLVRHTQAAVRIANDLLHLENNPFDPDEGDLIIAALILHDTCKSGIEWESKYTKHEHPLLAVELIKSCFEEGSIFPIEMERLISSHMGQWTTCNWSDIELPMPLDAAQNFVHICDYLASRKYLEFNFEV